MIATSHVIIGGTIGAIVAKTTSNPEAGAAAAVASGIVSHLLCDLLPHLDLPPNAKFIGDDVVWDKSLYRFAIVDSLIAFFLTLAIWYFQFEFNFLSGFAWGALGGYLPDLVDNFPLWKDALRRLPFFKQFHRLHLGIHRTWQPQFPMPKYWLLGTLTQVIAIALCVYYFPY